MPLAAAIGGYKSQLNAAWTKAKNAGMNENANSDSIISNLAADIAAATKSYMESAQVVTNHIISPGQTAPSSNPIAIGPGILSSPGSGAGPNGKLTFPTDATLKSDIEAAIRKARNNKKQDGASSDAIISSLALDLANAINRFALTGIVNTDINIAGGVAVLGYLGPPPASAPVPGVTGPGNGKGVGNLS